MKRLQRVVMLFSSVLCFGSAIVAFASDGVWSTEGLNSRRSDWDQLLGATIRVEGRVSLSGGGQLRLAKCDLLFRANEALLRSVQGKKSIEIAGRLKKENGKYLFDIDRLQILPSDIEQYESKTARLRNPKANEWYELGDWAAERSRFYDDAELARKARSAYDHGITAEWRALDSDDAEGRLRLADKVTQYMLPDSRKMELTHEGDRILVATTLKAKSQDKDVWDKLFGKLAEDLPDSTKPLPVFPEELRVRYEREPLSVYRDAPDEVRRQLHRILYVSTVLKVILEEAAKDGSNGDAIADRLERQIPEAKQLADQYRQRKLLWRLDQAATATRPEIEQLAADFRARQQPDLAQQALIQWLQTQEPRLRKDGQVGLMQLADDYLTLVKDERKAVTLLAEANKLDPKFSEVIEKLKALGYSNVGGTWIKTGNVATPAIPVEATIPETIAVGIDGAAARRAMGGRPGSLARVLTKKGADEIWSYGQPGTSRVIIRLEAERLVPDLRVTEIRNER